MRPISTRAHGVLDFATSCLLLVLPRAMGWSPTVTRLLTAAGATTAVYSLFTRYELGAAKLIPMKTHLMLDAAQGGMLMAAGAFLEDEDPEVREALAGIGAFEVGVTLLSQTSPPCPRGRYAGASRARSIRGTYREPSGAVRLPITRAAGPDDLMPEQLVGEDI